MIESRLILEDKDLFVALQQMSEPKRKEIAKLVAKWVIDLAHLDHPEIAKALDALESNAQPNPESLSTIERVLAEYDSEYLALHNSDKTGKAHESAVLAAFRRARAVHCLSFALKNEITEAVEAVYEACAATGDAKLVRAILHLDKQP
jgi:hypothetical protein